MLTHDTDTMRAEIAQHIAADAVRGGDYWDGQTGCFIGCLAHSSRAETLTERFGLPLPLVRICESIFERLPAEEQPVFFAEVGDALCDGQNLTWVHWAFLADTLRHLPDTDARNLVATVIDGMDRLARGDEWPEAARAEAEAWAAAAAAGAEAEAWAAEAAALAAGAAWAAEAAAWAAGAEAEAEAEAWAAEAAAWAAGAPRAAGTALAAGNAHSVWEAEVARQRQFLLDLLRAA